MIGSTDAMDDDARTRWSRREMMLGTGALVGIGLGAGRLAPGQAPGPAAAQSPALAPSSAPAQEPAPAERSERHAPRAFGIAINTATIRAQKIGAARTIELAARTGYQGVELWIDEIEEHERSGSSLEDLGKLARDLSIELPNAVAFSEWMVDDEERRGKALEGLRRSMDRLARIGCKRVAAPPAGNVRGVDLIRAAERYREILEIGETAGVIPALEIWGSSPALSRLGQAALVVIEARHPKACMVPDVFHLYKGGSGLDGVRFLDGSAIGIFHLNDYPAEPGREEARDSHRVLPGDGVAPLRKLIGDLRAIGYRGMLSVELFNRDLYQRDPAEVLREAIEKTRRVVEGGG